MAHVGPEKKAKIAAALKGVIPKGWKYSLAVRHHSTIVLTIAASPIDLAKHFDWNGRREYSVGEFEVPTYHQLNHFHYRSHMAPAPAELIETIGNIVAALNTDNFDESDSQSDYFHVGHYLDINLGRWDKPHQLIAAPLQVAA